jgi:tetratricopeptide (TPR) repeat protein
LALTAPARADEASALQQKATAAYALGEYKEAAEDFERAFKLHPDPALLYNAAQSHRLGGNKERALKLYESYLHVYGKKNSRAEEVQKHIDDLKAAMEHDKAAAPSAPGVAPPPSAAGAKAAPPATALPPQAATTPPTPPATASPTATSPPPQPATAPPPVTTALPPPAPSAPVLVAQPATQPADDRSLAQKPWFWVTIGIGVVAAVVVAVVVTSGGSKDPSPSLGKVNGYPP